MVKTIAYRQVKLVGFDRISIWWEILSLFVTLKSLGFFTWIPFWRVSTKVLIFCVYAKMLCLEKSKFFPRIDWSTCSASLVNVELHFSSFTLTNVLLLLLSFQLASTLQMKYENNILHVSTTALIGPLALSKIVIWYDFWLIEFLFKVGMHMYAKAAARGIRVQVNTLVSLS